MEALEAIYFDCFRVIIFKSFSYIFKISIPQTGYVNAFTIEISLKKEEFSNRDYKIKLEFQLPENYPFEVIIN